MHMNAWIYKKRWILYHETHTHIFNTQCAQNEVRKFLLLGTILPKLSQMVLKFKS